MERRLSVVTLGVADLDAAQRFYEDGFGWSVDVSEETIRFFQLNGVVFALYPRAALAEDARQPSEGHGFAGMTLAYNARTPEEVDEILARAEAAGGCIVKRAEDAFWGGYSGYVADPDGHLWEIAHNPFWTIDDEGNVSLGRP